MFVRLAWRFVRPIALVIGLLVLAFTVDVYFRFDRYADSVVERFLANARAPLDRELPLTAHAIPYASADIQPVGGQGDLLSCSVPSLLDRFAFPRRGNLAPISLRMRQACAFHDYCYRHGAATYGYSQADCDYLLLEHAYRICRFINMESTVSSCVTDARKVLLGVRLGGHENFKHADRLTPARWNAAPPCPIDARSPLRGSGSRVADDSCASSYFEFNPYPIRSQAYTVYRVADAPQSATPLMRKALYAFEIRPTATRLTIIGWTNDEKRKAYCVGYELPGAFKHLSVPPLVARSGGEGAASEDWLIWWRRFDLDQTGGHLAVIAPGRALLSDWTAVFSGATEFHLPESECGRLDPTGSPAGEARRASNVILIGESEDHKEDAEFSELHTAPALSPESGKIRLMGLRTHSCGRKQERPVPNPTTGKVEARTTNGLCFHDITIDPAGAPFQRSEPYLMLDTINRWHEGTVHGDLGDGFDPDRYRNFVTAPIPLAGHNAETTPALAWLRRGEARGETYDQTALLRRSFHQGKLGAGLPVVRLEDFPEWADPVFVFDRAGKPQLVSLREDRDDHRKIKMYRWTLPSSQKDYRRKIGENCNRPSWSSDPKRSLNDCAEAVVPRTPIAESCMRQIDSSWLVRRPVVLPPAGAGNIADIVFASVTMTAPRTENKVTKFELELRLRIAAVTAAGGCALLSLKPLKGEIEAPRLKGNDRERQVRETVAALRAAPVLVADFEPQARYVILPDAKHLAQTHLFRLQY